MVQLSATMCSCYHYSVSQSSKFCRHNPSCCFSTSVFCFKRIFRYRLSPENSGHTPRRMAVGMDVEKFVISTDHIVQFGYDRSLR
jgi:hypothetical protein